VSIPVESITNCDTKKFFNRANLYFTIKSNDNYMYTGKFYVVCQSSVVLLCMASMSSVVEEQGSSSILINSSLR